MILELIKTIYEQQDFMNKETQGKYLIQIMMALILVMKEP
jgi:hypothetical protein